MIPIGAPATATTRCNKYHGIVTYNAFDYHIRVADGMSNNLSFTRNEVKIRYDSPAPFTLWQLNVMSGNSANYEWFGKWQYVDLSNRYVTEWRKYSFG